MEKRIQDQETKGQDGMGQTRWMIANAGRESLEALIGRVKGRKSVGDILLPRLGYLDMSVEKMTEMAYINRATGYKIIKNTMRPGQDVLLRIAFALKFGPEETQELLKSGRCSLLTGSSERDVAIIYGLQNHLLLEEMDVLLKEYGLPELIPASPKEKR